MPLAGAPGVVTLTGSGVNQDGETVTFTVECGVELANLMATFTADNEARMDTSVLLNGPDNTCYRNP